MTSKQRQVLFKDSNCTVYKDSITIHLYYFPFGDKHIDFSSIQHISTGEQEGLSPIEMKGWGMGLSDVWWSADLKQRGLFVQLNGVADGITPVIIKVKNESTRKGFSTAQWPELKRVLMEYCPHAFE
jgi:hypothetical protein